MAKQSFKSVAEYIAKQPKEAREILRQVQSVLKKALPGAEEVISYQIAAYKLRGRNVIYFAGWKEHYSIYPATEAVREALGDKLADYKVNKGTIRFPYSDGVPARLIQSIAKARAKEAAASAVSRAKTG